MKKSLIASVFFVCILPGQSLGEISTPVRVADRPAAHCHTPKWSPDGQQLAVGVYNPSRDTRESWIVELGPRGRKLGEKEVTAGSSRASRLLGGKKPPVVEFAWAPSMQILNRPYVFSSRSPRKNFDLFADGAWITKNLGNDGQPCWSADGRFIAYASQQADSGDIFVIDLQGDIDAPKQATLWPNATEVRPKWSPTKNFLMFSRAQRGTKGQDIGIVMDVLRPLDSTRMVTNWDGDEVRPSWSPDGVRIAFYANRGKENQKHFDLFVIGANGQNAKKLASDVIVSDTSGPVWLPDGKTIMYVSRDYERNNPIRWVRADGSEGGILPTGTQINSDLALFAEGPRLKLAFRALGLKGEVEKTWQRIYLVTFEAQDLIPEVKNEAP